MPAKLVRPPPAPGPCIMHVRLPFEFLAPVNITMLTSLAFVVPFIRVLTFPTAACLTRCPLGTMRSIAPIAETLLSAYHLAYMSSINPRTSLKLAVRTLSCRSLSADPVSTIQYTQVSTSNEQNALVSHLCSLPSPMG